MHAEIDKSDRMRSNALKLESRLAVSNSNFYDQICAKECRNTHHKLVMNSLRRLEGSDAEKWCSLFVAQADFFLQGSKDPDTKFKDFRNHVLHVSDNYWGGPVKQAEKWYAKTVNELKQKNWKSAVYSAGVLSHYYMDPLMPLHTGQTEEEGVIHRACEWSVNKSFDSLIALLENGAGYPTVLLRTGDDWLKQAIHDGAKLAHTHYQDFIDHYNLSLGAKDPQAGLDDHLRIIIAKLLGHASVGFARILERAFTESAATPVEKSTSVMRIFYKLTAPVSWAYTAIGNLSDRNSVRKIVAEYNAKGKVVRALPRDEKHVRRLYAREVLNVELAELDALEIGPVGAKNSPAKPPVSVSASKGASRKGDKFRLNLEDALEDAPSIGAKTAQRFQKLNIKTVADFLSADPVMTAISLDTQHIKADTIRQWQTQAKLACQIPRIYGHDAQILAACGFDSPEEIANSDPEMVLSLVKEFESTKEAKFILRDNQPPDLNEVTKWVEWSQQGRNLKAA